MNKIILTGRLTAKPTSQVIKEVNVAKFNIANNDLNGTDTATNFFSCIAWGKKADYISKYCEKGDKVLICGYVKQN
jgi:Single-stranded DNA-binding protein